MMRNQLSKEKWVVKNNPLLFKPKQGTNINKKKNQKQEHFGTIKTKTKPAHTYTKNSSSILVTTATMRAFSS